MNRRGFLLGLGALMVAPAIVKATSLMPVKLMLPIRQRLITAELDLIQRTIRWHFNDGEFTQWMDEKCLLEGIDPATLPKSNGNYFEQVEQTIKARGCIVDHVPVLLPEVHFQLNGINI